MLSQTSIPILIEAQPHFRSCWRGSGRDLFTCVLHDRHIKGKRAFFGWCTFLGVQDLISKFCFIRNHKIIFHFIAQILKKEADIFFISYSFLIAEISVYRLQLFSIILLFRLIHLFLLRRLSKWENKKELWVLYGKQTREEGFAYKIESSQFSSNFLSIFKKLWTKLERYCTVTILFKVPLSKFLAT